MFVREELVFFFFLCDLDYESISLAVGVVLLEDRIIVFIGR